MWTLSDRGVKLCDRQTRRQWLQIGGIGSLGLSLPMLWEAQARSAVISGSFGRAKRCIVLFLLGGPPQHETWDPKPEAPSEIRGEEPSIATATPGLRVGQWMPRTAQLTESIAVLRAMATDDNAHSSSGYWMLTGVPHAPTNMENSLPGAPNHWPTLAATIRHLRGDQTDLPGAIRLPEEIWNTGRIVWPGQDAGWLGSHADPWLLTCDPNAADFHIADVSLRADVPLERLASRRSLLDQMNQSLNSGPMEAARSRWSNLQHQAANLLQGEKAKKAFALDQEPGSVRDRYGRNRFGQSVLLARRLIESGVSLVQVNWTRGADDPDVAPAWDTHANNSQRLKDALMPPMDLAYSALLEDLGQRGLLDETLVVWMGEFGRSPRINPGGGRDHWGHVFSAALAGGGVRGGVVHGRSDRQGGFPLEGRVEPQDLHATIYHCLGISPETILRDAVGRPVPATRGQPIEAILT